MGYFKTSIFILSGFLLATYTTAETFRSLSYSGRLVQSDGSPKTGVVNLEIKFFDSELEGNQKGSSYVFSSTSVIDGVFNLEIGLSDEDISAVLDPSTATWLEITDTTSSVTYPRQKLNSVPYAMRAGSVDNSSTSATSSNTSEAIVLRDSNGNFEVSEPTLSSHVSTKSYVDTQVSSSYSNSLSYTDTQVTASYASAVSYTDMQVAASYTNAVAYTDTEVASTYANAVAYTDTQAASTYANAVSYTDAKVAAAVPSGAINAFNLSSCPSGWLAADGGGGRPDLRGMFLRGLNNFGTGSRSDGRQDPDGGSRSLRSYQSDQMQSHKHNDSGHKHSARKENRYQTADSGGGGGYWAHGGTTNTGTGYAKLGNPTNSGTGAGNPRHGNETRPKNVGIIFCIKN